MIRSKHNNLLNYFICNREDLSKEYVRKSEKFLKEISDKLKKEKEESKWQSIKLKYNTLVGMKM